ncbi:MAG: ROK family protein [Microbacteriaceae bacterium]|nr:ROK family protein [Microbacteriaceae bacterium]
MRVGVDVGGTKTDAVAIDDSGEILHRLRVWTGFGAVPVLATTAGVVSALAGALRVPVDSFESVGVGVPGAVDSASGRVSHAVNLGLDELELGAELSRMLGLPVRVENDVNAAALGAFHPLSLPSTASMAYLNLGTGLAAGLVLDGPLWRGAWGTAGEIGHIPVDPNGPLCQYGQRGCLEMVASGSAVSRQWPSEAASPVHALFESAVAGKPLAIGVRQRFLANVASAVRILVLSVDVETVVIGGGISSLGDPLLAGLRAALDDWSHASPLMASLRLSQRVRLVAPGTLVAAVGAAFVGAVSPGAVAPGAGSQSAAPQGKASTDG